MATYKVVMVRHGESAWNKENRFCGWFDADLAETGVEEAKNAGKVYMNNFFWQLSKFHLIQLVWVFGIDDWK